MFFERRIPVVVATCPDCGAHYDARELQRLDVRDENDRLTRYVCTCGAIIAQSSEVLEAMRGKSWSVEDYATLSPADARARRGVLELTELGANLLHFALLVFFCAVVVWAIASG